jgi:phage tail sheath protein FI
MLVLDLPLAASQSADDATAVLERLDQELAGPEARAVAVYHPWTLVEARPGVGGGLAALPPGGQVAGVISRLDRERGPSRSPANETLVGAVDLAVTRESMGEPDLVGRRVNPIRCAPGRGLRIWGARTFHQGTAGRFVSHRRLLHRLVRAARQAAAPLVFEPDGPELRLALTRALSTVLLQAFRSGALAGRTASDAFTVRCDDTTTTPGDRDAGRVVTEIQLCHANPMEVIRVVLGLAAEGRLEVIEQ